MTDDGLQDITNDDLCEPSDPEDHLHAGTQAPEIKRNIANQGGQTSIVGFLPEIDAVASVVRSQIARVKKVSEETPDENQVKDLVSLTRLLQTLCDLASDARRAEQEKNGSGRDVLEFRKQLERKIAALAEEGQGDSFS